MLKLSFGEDPLLWLAEGIIWLRLLANKGSSLADQRVVNCVGLTTNTGGLYISSTCIYINSTSILDYTHARSARG